MQIVIPSAPEVHFSQKDKARKITAKTVFKQAASAYDFGNLYDIGCAYDVHAIRTVAVRRSHPGRLRVSMGCPPVLSFLRSPFASSVAVPLTTTPTALPASFSTGEPDFPGSVGLVERLLPPIPENTLMFVRTHLPSREHPPAPSSGITNPKDRRLVSQLPIRIGLVAEFLVVGAAKYCDIRNGVHEEALSPFLSSEPPTASRKRVAAHEHAATSEDNVPR
jgi:hypothetical protein